MRIPLARYSQPQSAVEIKAGLRNYLKAGLIASTLQKFNGTLTADGFDVVSRGGRARSGYLSTQTDAVAYAELSSAEKALPMALVAQIIGWDHIFGGYVIASPASVWYGCEIYTVYSGGVRYIAARHKASSGTVVSIQHSLQIVPGNDYKIVVQWLPGTELALFINGIKESVATAEVGSYGTAKYDKLWTGGVASKSIPYLSMFFFVGLTGMGAALSRDPWNSLFEPEFIDIASAVIPAALAGDASAIATSTGALTTAIPVTGASVVVATATGALSVPIDLAGAAAVISMSGGELTAQITLSGAATAQALSNAGLDTSILFAGDAISSASASGDLTTGSGLSGDASAQSVATASITAQIQLSASAVAQALAIGDLSVPTSGLSGDAASTSDASGILSTNILLAGDASAQVTGAGDLNTQIPLDGVAVNLISVTGDLTASITFSGAAAALVLAGADLTTQIPLSADALSQALATGFLTSGEVVTLKNPKYTVAAQARDYAVTEVRDYRVTY